MFSYDGTRPNLRKAICKHIMTEYLVETTVTADELKIWFVCRNRFRVVKSTFCQVQGYQNKLLSRINNLSVCVYKVCCSYSIRPLMAFDGSVKFETFVSQPVYTH